MSKFIVVLTNAAHGITVGTVAVCGNSGKRYGHSQYSDKYRCHAIEMTPEEYEVACDDLARGWHKALCKWVPHFVEVAENVITPENNEALREMVSTMAAKLTDADIRRIAQERGIILMTVPIETAASISIPHLSIGDPSDPARAMETYQTLPTKYLSLCKLARDEGVDISGLERKGEAVRAAILTHRQQKAA